MQETRQFQNQGRVPQAIFDMFIGALAMHGEITVTAALDHTKRVGHTSTDLARAIHTLIAKGLLSVHREGNSGVFKPGQGFFDLPQARLSASISALIATKLGVTHA